ncbi:MAG: hypothetical protein LBV08_10980 [Clostridiales bacterium]|jgi:hypothetical protein|nr:hypothetical protein [Clostridiales bacterium]
MFSRRQQGRHEDKKPEGIDKDTFKRIQEAYNIGENGKEITENKGHKDEFVEDIRILETIIQNAANTKEFYAYLLEKSHSSDKEVIGSLIENTNSIQYFLLDVYMKNFNTAFSPGQRDILRNIAYDKGITLALLEENKALNTYINLSGRRFNLDKAILLKICNINYLNLLN